MLEETPNGTYDDINSEDIDEIRRSLSKLSADEDKKEQEEILRNHKANSPGIKRGASIGLLGSQDTDGLQNHSFGAFMKSKETI